LVRQSDRQGKKKGMVRLSADLWCTTLDGKFKRTCKEGGKFDQGKRKTYGKQEKKDMKMASHTFSGDGKGPKRKRYPGEKKGRNRCLGHRRYFFGKKRGGKARGKFLGGAHGRTQNEGREGCKKQ